ncbi:hypothetical protein LOTGIDRAFT_133716 [Lottia gigantea]|uniref:Citrate transporter-like domain-containing protein n=1 Tax=Lottia gigantea TaxID=225164 RepID=V3ZQW5_LOTGI|nr:hypothetical protein LOTGIDRAFT_133716 [Lottia gigantea]ESO83286.1 hypothetical protein LOTGIDRAFT_133716 [Lottia gigantea]
MATIVQQLWSIRVVLLLVTTPMLLLPLPLYIGSQEAKAAFVLLLMAIMWVTEALPISVTALFPVFLFPMLGVVTAKEIAPEYMSDTLMIFIGGLIMATAIEVWDIHKLVALRILLLVGSKPRWLMLGLMIPTWFLSMFVSNTATTAMMIPIAQALLVQLKETHKLLKHISGRINQTILLFDRKDEEEDGDKQFKNVGKAISLCICYAANCGGIGALTGTGPNLVLKNYADDIYSKNGLKSPINYATWMAFGLPLAFLVLIVTWVWLQIFFLRCSDVSSCYQKNKEEKKDNKVHLLVKEQYDALGPISYAQKNVLVLFTVLVICWISRDLGGVGGWGNLFRNGYVLYVKDSTPAILIAVILFFLPSELPAIFCCRKLKDARVKTPRPLLLWQDAHEKLPWGIFILLGGGFALAKGCEVSGLSTWIGLQLAVFAGLNKWLMLLILCYICEFLTEFISNVALATLMVPILGNLAIATGVNPLFYILPAAVSTSFAYMLPVATAPNALCFSYGHIKVIDMAIAGFFMNVVAIPLLVFATFTWGDALFNFDVSPFHNGTTFINNTLIATI